jgi:hypothetical protein
MNDAFAGARMLEEFFCSEFRPGADFRMSMSNVGRSLYNLITLIFDQSVY